MRHWILCLLAISSFAASALGTVNAPKRVWVAKGFAQPAAVIYAPDEKKVFVSNVDGEPAAKDGKGFISLLDPDGTIVKRDWVTGLNAPKGMGYYNGLLYVADIDELLEIDTHTARILNRYKALGAKYFNGVSADRQGQVYVSDSGSNTIWRLIGRRFTIWVQDSRLNGPSGLFAEAGALVVASFGVPGDSEYAGYLGMVNLTTREIKARFAPIGFATLDGVTSDGEGGYFISDPERGNVYHANSDGDYSLWLKLDAGLSKPGLIPGRLLLLPSAADGTLSAYRLDDN